MQLRFCKQEKCTIMPFSPVLAVCCPHLTIWQVTPPRAASTLLPASRLTPRMDTSDPPEIGPKAGLTPVIFGSCAKPEHALARRQEALPSPGLQNAP